MFGWIKTFMLMATITALFTVTSGMISRCSGMMLALLFVLGTNFFSYWFFSKMVLRVYSTQGVSEISAPQFYRMVQELAGCVGLPMPCVCLIDEAQSNAFVTGRNLEHVAVAATTGILNTLLERELRDMMAHELTHMQHHDVLISTTLATMAGAISTLVNSAVFFSDRDNEGYLISPTAGIVMATPAPLVAPFIQMAISCARESEADRGDAAISDDP